MKKLLLTATCSIALIAGASQANAQNAMDRTFTGPYVGVQGGYSMSDADTAVGDLDLNGGDYGVFVGFQADTLFDNTVNKTGLGLTGALEFDYNWSTADDTLGNINVEKDHDWGVSFRPGLAVINEVTPFDWNPYGIVGYRQAEYEANVPGIASGEESYHGLELGIGAELISYDQVGVRVEYSHTWYGEENGIDPSENDFMVGLAYHF